ncbi:MAG: lamin tail domain-containing protein [Fidelibacterota bacterium]
MYDSTAGAYYYTANQTFASGYETQTVVLDLLPGTYSIDVWDSYGDGGVAGTVTDVNGAVLVSWLDSDYSSFGQFGFEVFPRMFDVNLSLTVDTWASEASWNLYDSTAGAYYYTANQTFTSGGETQNVTVSLAGGVYSVDVWDSYGDGGIAGTVTDANGNVLVTWLDGDYADFGQFGFSIGLFNTTIALTVDTWASEASWNLYDSTSGTYYYTTNQTFTTGGETQTIVFPLPAGHYSVDVWDSYGDGGIAGTVTDVNGNVLVTWLDGDYADFGQFGFEVLVPTNAPDLFFSEYVEGSGNNKALEVYNPTNDTLNLDNYLVYTNYNGNSWTGIYTFPAGFLLAPGDVFVAASADADPEILQAADSAYAYGDGAFITSFNGDDVRGLARIDGTDTTFIDLIGFYDINADTSEDPGSGWDVAGTANATSNHTLIRKQDVIWGNTNWTASAGTDSANSEWLVFPQDYSANLGGHPDDPCWGNEVNLTVTSVSWGSEINFYLTNDLGDTLISCFGCMSSYSTFTETFCLADGFYTFWGADDYGDSWGTGAGFVFTDADGNVLAAGDGPTSGDGTNWVSWTFGVGATPPAFAANMYFDMGGQAVGAGATTQSLYVTNPGGSDLTVSAVEVSGDPFSSTTTSFTVPGGATYPVDVSFDPATPDDFEGYMVFTSDAETSPDTVWLFGFGVDGVFFEDFDPPTGSYTDLPMEGWTILDNNGDADSIPQRYKTWYHDDYGLDGSGNMVAYMGYSNGYYADETLITPMISVSELSVVGFWMYNNYDRGYFLDVSYSTDGTTFNYLTSVPIHDFYEYVEVILPEVADQQIAFTFAPDSGGSYAYLNFDEVTVSAAPPVGTIMGTVTNPGGAPIEGVNVGTPFGVTVTDVAGDYTLNFQPVGLTELWFDLPGYHPAYFNVVVADSDTTVQDLIMVPDSATQSTMYYTGFETGEDTGQTFAWSGTHAFTVMDTFITGVDTILPSSGDYMLVFPDSGEAYDNNDYAYWLGNEFIDLTALMGGGFRFHYSAYISTESGWDYVYPVMALSDGNLYWMDEDGMSGDAGGWFDYEVDLSWAMAMGAEWAVPGFVFEADGSVIGGFGAAFDDVELLYDSFFLAPPMEVMAGSFGSDVPLSWNTPGPTGSVQYHLTQTDRSNFTLLSGDEDGTYARGKGPLPKEHLDVTYNYSNPNNVGRDLAGYKVYRKEWPVGEPVLLATVTENMYTDTDVIEGTYYNYAVSALYDEGESWPMPSNDVHVGAVTQLPAIGFSEDFEGLAGGIPADWQAFTTNPLGISWATGDSAAADTSGAFGYGTPAGGDSTDFAFVTDGRGGDFTFDTWLLSPFLDASDAYSALVSFSGYEQGWGNFPGNSTVAQLLVRSNMGPWFVVTDFSYDHYDGFVDYANDIQMVAAGQEYVQFAVFYHHEGGMNSGGGNGIAVDNLSVFNFAGPTNLVATPGTNVVDLEWLEPLRTLENLPETRELSAEKATLPSGTVSSSERETCFNHMSALAYFWSFTDSLSGPSSIFAFPEGPMELTAAQYGVYFPPDAPIVGSPVEMAVLVANADSTGATIDTIYSGIETLTAEAYANTYEVDLTGLVWESTGNNFIKVHFRPMTWADSIGGGGVNPAYTPAPLSDDGLSPSGLSGTDSAGVFYPSDYDFDLAICGTPTPPALSFNIYKDGMVVEEYFEDLFWSDFDVSPAIESCYYVAGVVPLFLASDAGDMIFVETERTNEVCATPINTPPTDFTLLAPVDGDTLFLTPDNIGMSTMFAWTPSLDPDGEEIWYTVEWSLDNIGVFYDLDTTGVAAFVLNADMYDDIETYGVTGLDITWTVWAGDGIDDVEATNGPRTFYVDATALLGVGDEAAIPESFALHQNYPNPFNPITTIEYDVPEITRVQIVIYNVMGQRIRTLVNSEIQPGYHRVLWNGTNDFGMPVASGMYFYQIKADNFNQVKKLILMK